MTDEKPEPIVHASVTLPASRVEVKAKPTEPSCASRIGEAWLKLETDNSCLLVYGSWTDLSILAEEIQHAVGDAWARQMDREASFNDEAVPEPEEAS